MVVLRAHRVLWLLGGEFLWGIGLVLNAWEVYWRRPVSEDRIRQKMARLR